MSAVTESGEILNLATFCTYSEHDQNSPEYKGIIFWVHGFSDYCDRHAHIAKHFARLGYDFFAMDMRGHGNSDGQTVLIQSTQWVAEDTMLFHRKVLSEIYTYERGYQKQPKCFVLAHSHGCQ